MRGSSEEIFKIYSAMDLPSDLPELAIELGISYSEVMPGEFKLIFPSKISLKKFQDELKEIQRYDTYDDLYPSRRDILNQHCGGLHTDEDIRAILELQNYRCYFSGAPISDSPVNYQIDHLNPISNGGSSWPINLALTTKEINLQKTYTTRNEFLKWLERKNGKEWSKERILICKKIDTQRKQIDAARKQAVQTSAEFHPTCTPSCIRLDH